MTPPFTSAMSGLRLDGVSITLGDKTIVSVSDEVALPGEVLTIMGPSGSGKSSLLAFISGTLAPVFKARGDIWLNGERLNDLPPERRRTGLLFQDDLLFPHMSVGGNLGFALPPDVRGRAARRSAIDEALGKAGLAGFAGRDPVTLSGGQRARVSLLRVLLSRPRALLLDEPFSKLDSALKTKFRTYVFAEGRASGLPTVLVTHDPADADAAGGRVVTLD